MFFNRKLTAFQERLEKLEGQVKDFGVQLDREKSDNARSLLEFAELSEKTRRLYLRLTRRAKIDSELTSDEVEPNGQNVQAPQTAREVRDAISQSLGV